MALDTTIGTVSSAILARRSVRAFSPEPVSTGILETLLATALRTPSGGNLQPWHIHVLTGPALDRLKQRMRDHAASGAREDQSHDVYPADLWEPYRSRRFENGEDLYRAIGVPRDDRVGRFAQLAQNFQFFGAPVGIFFAIDRRMGTAQWLDLGMIMQSVMLLAIEHGLSTCPQAAWALWPETLQDVLQPGDDMRIVAGMAMGFESAQHPINTLRSTRQSLDEGVTFHSA